PGARSELADIATAPAAERPVFQARAGVSVACGDLNDVREPHDGRGRAAVQGRSVAELAAGVKTPASYGPIVPERADVRPRARDLRDVIKAGNECRGIGRTVAEVARGVA